ncbi:MAG: hypothetical protein AAGD12_04720 [Pseudomonadota bacterium]
MRRVSLDDVLQLAAVLRAASGQRARYRRMIAVFKSAARDDAALLAGVRVRGDGTVAGVCRRVEAVPACNLDDPDYCACLATVLRFLARRGGAAGLHLLN